MIDGCQGLIHQIKIIDGLRHNVLQWHSGEIERAAIALPAIGTLDHRARDREAMDATDQRSMIVETTATVLQEHTGLGCINHTPWINLLETRQQVLPRLRGKRCDCLRKVMRLDGKQVNCW